MDSLIVIHTLILEQNIVMNDSKSMTLGFIEMYYVPVDKTQNNQRLYLTTVLEVHSFLGWAELSLENSALSTMFSVLRAFNYLKQLYEVQFQKIITSKKQEFVSRSKSKETKHNHPVERLFVELGIQYQCTYHTKFHFEKKTNHFFHLLKKRSLGKLSIQLCQTFSTRIDGIFSVLQQKSGQLVFSKRGFELSKSAFYYLILVSWKI